MWFVPSFQREHEHLLRPNLGHPHQKDKLAALYDQETQRHKEYLDAVDMRTSTLQVIGLQMRVSDISTNFHNNIVMRGQRKCFKWFMTYKQIKHSLLDSYKGSYKCTTEITLDYKVLHNDDLFSNKSKHCRLFLVEVIAYVEHW